jgi:hypothetical protein
MKLADGIRKHGFRKWYERELLQSHAHLTLTFLCTVGIFAALEASSKLHGWLDQLTDAAAVLICAGVGVWALRRYLWLLSHAEAVAHQAECSDCGSYGRLALVHPQTQSDTVDVRCKQCERVWRIES